MFTAILTAIVVWCLFYGQLPKMLLVAICIAFFIFFILQGKHNHARFLTIDVLAQSSRLNKVNSGLKLVAVLLFMVLSISARSPVVGLFLTIVISVFIVWIGGLKLHDYIHLLALPVTFLLLSGLALLFEVTRQPAGVLNLHLFGFWFCVTESTQTNTALVMARTLGAVSSLYLLSLTTPMAEIIGVLRRAHCPNVIINLMYLIYRYLFIILSMYYTMKDAAKSRLGFESYRTSIRTTGSIYSNLLARSYRQANRNYDAMESRCFDEDIRFLEHRYRVCGMHAGIAGGIAVASLALSILLH